jgi:hypothetical protein
LDGGRIHTEDFAQANNLFWSSTVELRVPADREVHGEDAFRRIGDEDTEDFGDEDNPGRGGRG